ncbi:MAG TPA: nitroreductase family deazaflavin-dependent oxidoreductase [Solirubrobacterales bacterium]|nr:nitroreductase family deazaflavin-dependent oxidoreductase [Solirubrobacterales bacterium]
MLSDRFVAKFSNTIGARGLRRLGKLNVPAYRLSGGRIGSKVGGGPILLLTTTGRRSGEPRTAPILYLERGEAMVVIDTNGGNEKLPAWSHNLKAKPEAEVQVGRRKLPVTARVAAGAERAELWRACNEQYGGFDEYVEWMERTPSVWVLEPLGATPDRQAEAVPARSAPAPEAEEDGDVGTTRESAAAAEDTSPSDII